jgi:hypothetical protein
MRKEVTMITIPRVKAALEAVMSAIGVAKKLISADEIMKNAELKLQFAELIGKLADAQTIINEVEKAVRKKDEEIVRLHEALRLTPKVERYGNAYYEKSESGDLVGSPYCSHCWETEYRCIHLTRPSRTNQPMTCPGCHNSVPFAETPEARKKREAI